MSVNRDSSRPPVHDSAAAIVERPIEQELADDLFHRAAVGAEDVGPERGDDLVARRAQGALPPRRRRPTASTVQFDLTRRGENRRLDRRCSLQPPRVDRLRQLLDVRLPASRR